MANFKFNFQDVIGRLLDNDSQIMNKDYGYYRHSEALTIVYCIAYVIVFLVGLIGNSFVIAVVLRSPRMRTVTNYFIVNLAVADILVIVFCLPATLMSNIFVREYFSYFIHFSIVCLCVFVIYSYFLFVTKL